MNFINMELLFMVVLAAMTNTNFVKSTTLRKVVGRKLGDDGVISPPKGSDFHSRTLQTCNLGEDFVDCETTARACADFVLQDCTINCIDDYSCEGATIDNDSSVFCQTSYSCKSASIENSNVVCSDSYSCSEAKIRRSYVKCSSMNSCASAEFSAIALSCGGEFQSCSFAEWKDECSCCYENCDGLQSCTINGAPNEEFCASESAGVTCAELGNPICKGMRGYPNSTTSNPKTNPPAASEPTDDPQPSPPPSSQSQTNAPAPSEPTDDPHGSPPPYSQSQTNPAAPSEPTDDAQGSTPMSTVDIVTKVIVPILVALITLAGAWIGRKQYINHQQTK